MKTGTVAELLADAAETLGRAGVARPLPEAEQILCHVFKEGRTDLYLDAGRPVEEVEGRLLRKLLLRRADGCPLQYLTGRAGFYTCEFTSDRRALIPRPDTEALIDVVLDLAVRGRSFGRIADIGTGCGNIAIVLALHFPRSEVLATDISGEAISLARENAERNGVEGRVHFLVADLLDPLAAGSFDLIVSNPPYIPDEDWPALPAEVRDHEPAAALKGGGGGLEVIRKLARDSREALGDSGTLVLEFGDGQASRVRDILDSCGYSDLTTHRDINGKPRVAVAFKNKTED